MNKFFGHSLHRRTDRFIIWKMTLSAAILIVLALGFYGCSVESPTEAQDQLRIEKDAGSDVVPGQYIVVMKSTNSIGTTRMAGKVIAEQVADVAIQANVEPKNVYTTVLYGFSSTLTNGEYQALLNDPRVDYIEPDHTVTMVAQTTPWGISTVKAPAAHARGVKGNGVKVGIIDTGIDYNHPDLSANYAGGIDYVNGDNDPMDDAGHGTHVSGTVAALDNGIGVIGVAPAASLYGIKVLDQNGSGTYADVIAGIDWAAANGMDVVNMSLSGSSGTASLKTSCDNAYASGVVLFGATGNDYGWPVGYPAAYNSVVAVTAIDQSNNLASFSNVGPEVEVTAPGVSVYSTTMGGGYGNNSGTSMACPHAAGVAALIWSTGLYGSASAVRTQMTNTCVDLGPNGRDNSYGYGLVDADAGTVGGGGGGTPPVANFSGTPTSGTAPLAVSFTDQSTNTPTSWNWDFGDGGTSTQQNPNYTYNTAGTYTVTMTATNASGSDQMIRTNYITVNAPAGTPPVANFSGTPTSGTTPLAVAFTDQSTNTPTSWNWDFGDGGTSTQQNPNYTYNTAGTYTVTLTVSNVDGSDQMIRTNYITANAPAGTPPVANFSGTPTSGTAPLAVAFTDQSTNTPTSWNWDFGDGGTSTQQNPNYTYNTAGTYTVTMTVSNVDGSDQMIRTNYISVTSGGGGGPTGEGFILSRNADFSTDDRSFTRSETMYMKVWSDQVDFTNMSRERWEMKDSNGDRIRQNFTNNGDGTWTASFALSGLPTNLVDWTWKGEVKDNNGTRYKPSTAVTVTSGGGGGNQAPTANANGPYNGTVGNAVSFSSAGSSDPDGTITGYSWDFGDGGTSTAANPSYTYGGAGTYTVTLTVTDDQGATGSNSTSASITTGGGGGSDNVIITKAQYDAGKQKLDVRAESDNPNATLTVVGYGVMTYKPDKNRWELKLEPVSPGPTTITVTSDFGGSATSNVTWK